MAYSITDFNAFNPISADYPNGDIKDRLPGVEGTNMDRKAFADMFQFFQKLMDDAGVVPNGKPDNANAANGFQLIEALYKRIGLITDIKEVGQAGAAPFQGLNIASGVDNKLRYYKIGNEVVIDGSWQANYATTAGSDIVFTLPVGYRPLGQKLLKFSLIDGITGNAMPSGLSITPTGEVAWKSPGGSGDHEMFVGTVRFTVL